MGKDGRKFHFKGDGLRLLKPTRGYPSNATFPLERKKPERPLENAPVGFELPQAYFVISFLIQAVGTDLGRVMGSPRPRAMTACAQTPSARETANRTV